MPKSADHHKLDLARKRSIDASRDEAIAAKYRSDPSLLTLLERGEIDQSAYDRMVQARDAGPPIRPFAELISQLRAEREGQGLSLADIARRSGMDKAAIHKLEIGLNKNPTFETIDRYVRALNRELSYTLIDPSA